MDGTRRGFLKAAVTAVGATATPNVVQIQGPAQTLGHEHQTVPSDLTLRVKSLESLLVEKGLVDRVGPRCAHRHDGTQGRPAQRGAGDGARLD